MDLSRTEILIGEKGLQKISSKHITIVGVGGVGGYVAVMLARAGVTNMTLIDFDKVTPSNVNRQIMAFNSTIGRPKVEVLKEMLLDINDKMDVKTIPQRLCEENICDLIGKTNLVVDAIDSVKDKVSLIVFCKENNIPILSAMGAGNRFDYPQFEVTDIFKTSYDGLAKALRHSLRKKGVKDLEVVTSKSQGIKSGDTIGSISYYPAAAGCYIAAVVVNKILRGEI